MKTIIELPTHKRDSNEFASEVHQEEASRAHCLLLDEAAAIGAIVSQSPSFAEGGIAPWTGRLQHDPWSGGREFSGHDLYGGTYGICLFLAALDHISEKTEYRSLVCAVVQPLRTLSSTQVDDWLARDGVGAGTGSFSIIYSLARIATFMGDEELLSAAIRIARRFPHQRIVNARGVDLMGGSAGCALVCASLHSLAPEPWMIEQAALWGKHLLRARITTSSGLRAWETSPGKCQTGYAHGAAGIIQALCRLFEITGESSFRDAAAEALAYENSLYCEDEGNWPHLLLPREQGGYQCWNSWCNGAPGIGLGRLNSSCLDQAEVSADIDRCLRAAAKSGTLSHIDFPCCGTLGRVEFFLEAARKLGIERHKQQAVLLANSVARRAITRGRYGFGRSNDNTPLTFHKGLAGIGYQLLRAAKPELLPSVLSWE